jgi:hypothetical protein
VSPNALRNALLSGRNGELRGRHGPPPPSSTTTTKPQQPASIVLQDSVFQNRSIGSLPPAPRQIVLRFYERHLPFHRCFDRSRWYVPFNDGVSDGARFVLHPFPVDLWAFCLDEQQTEKL